MAEAKTKENEDITFNREELLADDVTEAAAAREKRNSPMPTEEAQKDPTKLDGWPFPEDKKPAVMRADSAQSLDYKLKTHEEVDEDQRKRELAGTVGQVAQEKLRDQQLEAARNNKGLNDVIAPPSPAAREAAEGRGAVSAAVPVRGRNNTSANNRGR